MSNKIKVIIAICIIIGIIVIAYLTDDKNTPNHLECKLNKVYNNYEETLDFSFIENVLFTYERKEIVTSKDIENDIKVFENIKENAPENAYFKYNITSDEDNIYINTYIEAFHAQDFYDEYIFEKNISFTYTLDEIKKTLEYQNYTCKKSYK